MTFPFFLFGHSPEEAQELFHKQQEHQQMIREDTENAIKHLIDDCPTDFLVTLRKLLIGARQDQTGCFATYYDGVITHELNKVRGVCEDCGETHPEDDPHSLLKQPAQETEQHAEESKEPEISGSDTRRPEETEALMEKYGVEMVDENDPHGGVKCTRCRARYWYPSLTDRMLRSSDAGGCPGCVHENKYG